MDINIQDVIKYSLLSLFALGLIWETYGLYRKRNHFLIEMKKLTSNDEIQALIWYTNNLKSRITVSFYFIPIITFLLWLFISWINPGSPDGGPIPGYMLYYIVVFLIGMFFNWAWRTNKSNQKTVSNAMKEDPRPPILFLRTFEQDGELFMKINNVFTSKNTQLFTHEATAIGSAGEIGPVIAIASPMSRLNDFLGASREHVSNWQEKVSLYMHQASLIIMRPYYSNGIFWEFEQLFKFGYLSKTTLYIGLGRDKKSVSDHLVEYDVFKQKVEETYGIKMEEHNRKALWVYFNDANEAFTTSDQFDIPAFRKAFYSSCVLPELIKKEVKFK